MPRVHAGNTVDAKTLQEMAQDFRQRFQVDHCLVVGDSGLLSKDDTGKLDEWELADGRFLWHENH